MRAVLFDFDGTLLDSFEDIVGSMNHTLVATGRHQLPAATVRSYIGDGLADMVGKALTETDGQAPAPADVDAFVTRYRAWYAEHWLDTTKLYPGAQALLDALAARGDRLALVSNKAEGACRGILATLGLESVFEVVSGGDTYPERKPDAGPVRRTLERLDVPLAAGVMIGDGPQDIGAGRAAGVRTIGVGWGLHPGDRLADAGTDVVVESFEELREALRLEP